MFLLVGLGNPGKPYAGNRHNIGFMTIDAIAASYALQEEGKKFSGILGKGKIDGQPIIVLKPQTFMNRSGESVQAATAFYKIPPQNIIVFHDELDLAFGKVRIKQGGGNGGHNGLKDIDAALGADYWRVRLGIGRPEHQGEVSAYVLSDFSAEEKTPMHEMIASASRHIGELLAGRPEKMANNIALDLKDVLPKPPASDKQAE
ncbi:MAG: aminoacyl-tRNA hydrolase [Rickettsiales bacterium]